MHLHCGRSVRQVRNPPKLKCVKSNIKARRKAKLGCGAMATYVNNDDAMAYNKRVTIEAVDSHMAKVGRMMPR